MGRFSEALRSDEGSVRWYVWVALAAVVVIVLFVLAFRNPRVVPSGLQNAMEAIVDFIRNGIVMEVMGPAGLPWVPFLTSMFMFIFVCNVFEILPFINFPATSRFAISSREPVAASPTRAAGLLRTTSLKRAPFRAMERRSPTPGSTRRTPGTKCASSARMHPPAQARGRCSQAAATAVRCSESVR